MEPDTNKPDAAPAAPAPTPTPTPEPAPTAAAPAPASGVKSADERKQLLARALQTQIAQGARIESQSDFQAVVVKGKHINHVLHLIITLFTFFLWGIVWLILAVTGGEKRSIVSVDEYGNVSVQKV
jgi:hypothetical protein